MKFCKPAISDSELGGSGRRVGERRAHTVLPEMQFKGRKHLLRINGFGRSLASQGSMELSRRAQESFLEEVG